MRARTSGPVLVVMFECAIFPLLLSRDISNGVLKDGDDDTTRSVSQITLTSEFFRFSLAYYDAHLQVTYRRPLVYTARNKDPTSTVVCRRIPVTAHDSFTEACTGIQDEELDFFSSV